MILVDTSVWIDFFANRPKPHVDTLRQRILNNDELAICGIVLTEVLQGIRDDKEHQRVKEYMSYLMLLPLNDETFLHAAQIYRTLRKQGITIRKTNDCLIAAVALENNCALLHNDSDFRLIAKAYPQLLA